MRKRSTAKLALSVFLAEISATFLSFIIVFLVGGFTNNAAVNFLMQAFLLVMYFGFIYSNPNMDGDRERNLIRVGQLEENKLKGLNAGLIAMLPKLLTSILLVLVKLGVTGNFPQIIYRMINSQFVILINHIMPSTDTGNMSIPTWGQIAVVTALQLLIPLISGMAYFFGYRGIHPIRGTVLKKDVKK